MHYLDAHEVQTAEDGMHTRFYEKYQWINKNLERNMNEDRKGIMENKKSIQRLSAEQKKMKSMINEVKKSINKMNATVHH